MREETSEKLSNELAPGEPHLVPYSHRWRLARRLRANRLRQIASSRRFKMIRSERGSRGNPLLRRRRIVISRLCDECGENVHLCRCVDEEDDLGNPIH